MQDIVKIERNDAAERYELTLDGERVGFAQYRATPGRIVFTHTVVEPEHEGQGIAGSLARELYGMAAREGVVVAPLCPYVVKWAERHPDEAPAADPALLNAAVEWLKAHPGRF